jgi:hypothetical protein
MEDRLRTLERRCRILTWALLSFVVVFSCAAFQRESNFDVIRTKKLAIIDDDGISRIELTVAPEGALLSMTLPDQKHATYALQCGKEGVKEIFTDSAGIERLSIASAGPTAGFYVRDANNKLRISQISRSNTAAFTFYDYDGKIIERFGSLADEKTPKK